MTLPGSKISGFTQLFLDELKQRHPGAEALCRSKSQGRWRCRALNTAAWPGNEENRAESRAKSERKVPVSACEAPFHAAQSVCCEVAWPLRTIPQSSRPVKARDTKIRAL